MATKKKTARELQPQWILDAAKKASYLRSKEREFHGLEHEFRYVQDEMLKEFAKSAEKKHPRVKGDIREDILRGFLSKSGYIPKKIGVSEENSRVVSTSGHCSNEIDILFFDYLNSITLTKEDRIFTVYPEESVYGVIQVKSLLTKPEIQSGFENIASFKRLSLYSGKGAGCLPGFGILFAYDTNMDWVDVVREVESNAKLLPYHLLPNAVVILGKGLIFHGTEHRVTYTYKEMCAIDKLVMHGRPDRDGTCLLMFYNILIDLLNQLDRSKLDITKYFRLPLTAGKYSYCFSTGYFQEVGKCHKHGEFQKKLSESTLSKLLAYCDTVEPINWIKAMDLAMGEDGNNHEAYERQPGAVRIYNPENLSYPDIFRLDNSMGLLFDSIECNGLVIWVPFYYDIRERIFEECPKCKANSAKRRRKQV